MTTSTEAAEVATTPAPLTVVSVDGKVHCRKWETCHTWVNPGTKTGYCRPCVTEAWRTGEFAHPKNEKAEPRKREVEHRESVAKTMLRRLAEQAMLEDPGRGLRAMLEVLDLAEELTNRVGEVVTDRDGTTVVGQETRMGKKAVDNRWGEGAAISRAIARGECTCHAKPSRDKRPVQTGDPAACVYHQDKAAQE